MGEPHKPLTIYQGHREQTGMRKLATVARSVVTSTPGTAGVNWNAANVLVRANVHPRPSGMTTSSRLKYCVPSCIKSELSNVEERSTLTEGALPHTHLACGRFVGVGAASLCSVVTICNGRHAGID